MKHDTVNMHIDVFFIGFDELCLLSVVRWRTRELCRRSGSVESSGRRYTGRRGESERSLHRHPNHVSASYQADRASIHCTHTHTHTCDKQQSVNDAPDGGQTLTS